MASAALAWACSVWLLGGAAALRTREAPAESAAPEKSPIHVLSDEIADAKRFVEPLLGLTGGISKGSAAAASEEKAAPKKPAATAAAEPSLRSQASPDAEEASAAGAARLYRRAEPLFWGGHGHPRSYRYHSYRIPSVLGIGGGRLLAFAEGRARCRADYGDVDLVYKVSNDSGASWSEMTYLAGVGELAGDTWGNPTAVYEQPWAGGPLQGRVHLFFNHNDGEFREGRREVPGCPRQARAWRPVQHGDRQTYYAFSDDGGRSWSARQNWTQELLPENFTWDAAGPGIGLQKMREPNRSMLVVPAISRNLISTDHGKSWTFVMATQNESQLAMSEATVAECADGRLYRNDRPGPRAFAEHRSRWVLYQPRPDRPAEEASEPDARLPDPKSEGSSLSYEPGLLLFLNSDHPGRRTRLRVRLSTDCGRSWPIKKALYDGPPDEGPYLRGGYTSMTRTGDEVAVLTEGNYASGDDFDRRSIDFLRFDLNWLCDGEAYCRGASCAIQAMNSSLIYLHGGCARAALGAPEADAAAIDGPFGAAEELAAGSAAEAAPAEELAKEVTVQLRRDGVLLWQGPITLLQTRDGSLVGRCPEHVRCEERDDLIFPVA